MKAWLCTMCGRVLFGSPRHFCAPPFARPRSMPAGAKVPKVGVAHIASVRKWCEK